MSSLVWGQRTCGGITRTVLEDDERGEEKEVREGGYARMPMGRGVLTKDVLSMFVNERMQVSWVPDRHPFFGGHYT